MHHLIRFLTLLSVIILGLATTPAVLAGEDAAALKAARAVMDDFMTAFNARDEAA